MHHYQELSSAKYLKQSQAVDYKEYKRLRSRKAVGDFTTFLCGLGAIVVGMKLAEAMPYWLPQLEALWATWVR